MVVLIVPGFFLFSSLKVPFDFIGRKTEIENAKMMMEYHLEHLKVEVDSEHLHSRGERSVASSSGSSLSL